MNVQLRYCNLEKQSVDAKDLMKHLPGDEVSRARTYFREADRLSFCVGRILMRNVLAPILGQSPREILIERDGSGKPFVDGGPAFNLSHSGTIVLFGLAAAGQIGVDVEKVRPLADLTPLVERCLSRQELEGVRSRNSDERLQAFFRGWTRKEALAKAMGQGLGLDLRSFSVSLDDIEGNVLLEAPVAGEHADGWSILSVDLPGPYAAAVAKDSTNFSYDVDEFFFTPAGPQIVRL